MIELAFLILWGLWLLLILVSAFRVYAFLIARRRQEKRWGNGPAVQKQVALIVAVKGFDLKSTPGFFDALFAQAYSDYRVLVAFESWDDPSARWLKEELELDSANPIWHHPDSDSGLKSITLVCADRAIDEGQKVHNLRAAFDCLQDSDRLVVFADADISLGHDWLARLTAPLNLGSHKLSTTYRWLIPARPTLPNQLASVINGSIATQGGWELTNVLWGGSMAVSREVFDELDVPALFRGSLNDDLRLSKAARKAGNRIAFIRSLILPTRVDFTWKSFFEFAKRQYTQVKFFSPVLYFGTNFLLGFYALGAITLLGALAYGYFFAWVPIAAAYVIDQFRGLARQQIYLTLFPDSRIRSKLFATSWLEHMFTPFWMLLHWGLLVSTWTQNRITWAGITYRILSPSRLRILDHPITKQALPVGVPGLTLLGDLRDRKRGRPSRPLQPVAASLEPALAASSDADLVSSPVQTPTRVARVARVEPETFHTPVPHPGVSPFVTALSVLPSLPHRKRAQAMRLQSLPVSFPRSRVGMPRAFTRAEAVARRGGATTQPTPQRKHATDFPSRLAVPAASRILPKDSEVETIPIPVWLVPAGLPLRTAAAPATFRRLAARRKQAPAGTSDAPQRRKDDLSRSAKRLRKPRASIGSRFPTNPELGFSSPPLPPPCAEPTVLLSASPAPLGQLSKAGGGDSVVLPSSCAAHRSTRGPGIRQIGPLFPQRVRSARTNHVSHSSRGNRILRPSSNRPSGRPNRAK